MPTAVRALLAAVLATAGVVGAGVALRDPDEAAAPPPTVVESTTLADLDTTALAARRSGFCSGIGSEPVAAALGGEPAAEASYDNGDRVPISVEVTDVAHEYGCSWTGADGTEARGWVFAPPVTAARARLLARATARAPGCQRQPDAAGFGSPSVGVLCTADGDGGDEQTVSLRGLFGDAWLACSLRVPAPADPAALTDRADRWCAAVVVASTSDAVAG